MANLPLIRARNALADGFQRDAADLAGPLVAGSDPFVVRLARWLSDFFGLIRHGITGAFLLGRGSRGLTEPDARIVAGLIDTQHGFARGFAADLRAAADAGQTITEAAVATRSGLYAGGSVIHPFHAGESARWNVVLPAYPGDGSSECQGNCRCSLSFEDTGTVVLVTWHGHDDGRICPTCQERADTWNPLNLNRPEGLAA